MKTTTYGQLEVGMKLVDCDCLIGLVESVTHRADGTVQVGVRAFGSLQTDEYDGRIFYRGRASNEPVEVL